jgi:hypothetical protein
VDEEAQKSDHLAPFRLSNPSCRGIIKNHQIRPQLPSQDDGLGFSVAAYSAQALHGTAVGDLIPDNSFGLLYGSTA